MKTLIVYFTRTNTTRIVAEELGKKLSATVEELKDKQNWSGVSGYLKGGRAGMKKSLTEIEPLSNRIEDFDLVVIGSPVWVGNMPPAIRTFVTDNKSKIKKVAFFVTQGSEKIQRIFTDFSDCFGQKPIAEMFLSTKRVRGSMIESDLNDFVGKIS